MKITTPFAVDYRVWGKDPRWNEYIEKLKNTFKVATAVFGKEKKEYPYFGATTSGLTTNQHSFFFDNNIITLDEALDILKPKLLSKFRVDFPLSESTPTKDDCERVFLFWNKQLGLDGLSDQQKEFLTNNF